MIDQLVILAEGGSHAAEGGLPPALVGGGFFIILMCLLGITYLFSGMNQPSARSRQGKDTGASHGSSSTHDAAKH